MNRAVKLNTPLTCGCCGVFFRTWDGYVDQDQDDGYGICESCQKDIAERDEKEWDKAIATLREALNDDNRAKFDAMDREKQKRIVWKALDEGVLTFKIRPAGGL